MHIPIHRLRVLLSNLREDLKDHTSELPRALILEAVEALEDQARSEEQPTIEDRLTALSTWVKTIQDNHPGDLVKRLQDLEAKSEDQPLWKRVNVRLVALENQLNVVKSYLPMASSSVPDRLTILEDRTKACVDNLPASLRDRLRTVEERVREFGDTQLKAQTCTNNLTALAERVKELEALTVRHLPCSLD